jgi:hypothetical protein
MSEELLMLVSQGLMMKAISKALSKAHSALDECE